MFIFALVLLFFASIAIANRRAQLQKYKEIHGTPTSQVADVEQLGQASRDKYFFRIYAELKGVLYAQEPLTAQFSQKPCVYVRSQVIEKGEEAYSKDGSKKIRQYTKPIADDQEYAEFVVLDNSGAMAINPIEATIEAVQVYSKFKPSSPKQRYAILQVGQKRILGYQRNEWILPLNQRMYVLGEVTFQGDTLQLGKPADSNHQFLISHRSETQLLKEKQKFAAVNRNWSIFLLAIAMVIILRLNFDKQPIHHLVYILRQPETERITEIKAMTPPAIGQKNLYVQVTGKSTVAKPLKPQFSDQAAIYVRTLKEAKYREEYEDSKGRAKTRKITTTIFDNVQAIAFQLEDNTGSITVNPQGAEFDALQVWNNFEPHTDPPGNNSKRQLLGYRYREWIMPMAQPTFVVGTLTQQNHELMIQSPLRGWAESNSFVISHRPKATFLHDKQEILKNYNWKILTLVCLLTILVCWMVKKITI